MHVPAVHGGQGIAVVVLLCAPCSIQFLFELGILTQVLMFTQQALLPMEYLLSLRKVKHGQSAETFLHSTLDSHKEYECSTASLLTE